MVEHKPPMNKVLGSIPNIANKAYYLSLKLLGKESRGERSPAEAVDAIMATPAHRTVSSLVDFVGSP